MDGQTGLNLDDNWEIICPWAQIMVGTTMPIHITENMIEMTDEILEKLKILTLLEATELVTQIEETFGEELKESEFDKNRLA